MGSIDSKLVVLTCAPHAHGSRRRAAFAGVPTVALPARPGRADLDPVLAEHDPRRLAVVGTDADLAAVLLRLLRSGRLDIEVAFVAPRRSAAARIWGLSGRVDGVATPVPLIRDDTGGVLVGRAEIRGLRGECFCDDALVLRGATPRLVVAAGPGGVAVRAGRGSRLPDGRTRAVSLMARSGRGSAVGRAVQVGGSPFTTVADGVAYPRPLERRTWFRHTADWLLVRPHP